MVKIYEGREYEGLSDCVLLCLEILCPPLLCVCMPGEMKGTAKGEVKQGEVLCPVALCLRGEQLKVI